MGKDLATGQSKFKLDNKEMKKHFGNCWIQILKCKINLDQYKRVLTILHDKVLPFLPRPLLLTDFLLSSTHLPSYVVAAFTKKLARLCLTAPSTTIPMAIRFIHNLIFRHPSLAKLIDNDAGDVS